MLKRSETFTIRTPLGRCASITLAFECDEAASAAIAHGLLGALDERLRAACARRSCTVEHSFVASQPTASDN